MRRVVRGSFRAYLKVSLLRRREPATTRASQVCRKPSTSLFCEKAPRQRSSSSLTTPRPWVEVMTPTPMSSRRLTCGPACRAPPPSHSSGRVALARRSATRSRASGAGTATGIGNGERSVGMGMKVDWMSIGISTLTGPVGAVRAVCTASFRVLSAVSTLRTRKAALDTALSMVSWSRAS
ncbi:hypothetical protein D3C76_919150 [compost metagenome]